jgi:hypothetical protein
MYFQHLISKIREFMISMIKHFLVLYLQIYHSHPVVVIQRSTSISNPPTYLSQIPIGHPSQFTNKAGIKYLIFGYRNYHNLQQIKIKPKSIIIIFIHHVRRRHSSIWEIVLGIVHLHIIIRLKGKVGFVC